MSTIHGDSHILQASPPATSRITKPIETMKTSIMAYCFNFKQYAMLSSTYSIRMNATFILTFSGNRMSNKAAATSNPAIIHFADASLTILPQ